MLLSFIIPIYKAELFIVECLESIIKQIKDKDIEIICIDDGSPDNTINILSDFFARLEEEIRTKIIFFSQENKGVSEARNKGLQLAKGKYIAFVDSDDKILDKYVEKILECIYKNDPDIIDFNLINSQGKIIYVRSGNPNNIYSVFKAAAWYNCARVIKKELIEDKFISGIYYEDFAFFPSIYIKSKNTVYLNYPLYWYRLNIQGITMTVNQEGNLKTIKSLELILNHFLDLYYINKDPYYSIVVYQSFFLLCVNACRRYNIKKSLYYIDKYKIVLRKVNLLSKFLDKKILFFYYFPKFYIFFYRIYCVIKKDFF